MLWAAGAIFFLLLAMGPALHAGNITMAEVPADLSLGADAPGWTPFAALNRWIPFMRISRSVSRYALMVQFGVAVLAGMGLHTLLQKVHGRGRAGITAAAALLVLGEYWTAPYPLSPPDTPALYTQLAQEPGQGAVLNLPMNYDRPGYLLYQTVHQRPLTVAYISRDDPAHHDGAGAVLAASASLGAGYPVCRSRRRGHDGVGGPGRGGRRARPLQDARRRGA